MCDPSGTLIQAIGMKKGKGTTRGVFVVEKEGKVLAAEPGGPAATVEVVRKLVGTGEASAGVSEDVGNLAEGSAVEKEIEEGQMDAQEAEKPAAANGESSKKEDEATAQVAADVADSAQILDGGIPA